MIVDADVVAREVVEPGSAGLAELVAHFGSDILDSEGALDRPAMARRVFDDDAARSRLNSTVHPRIASRTAELITRAPSDAIVVHDIPLLVEAGYAPNYHLVVIVDAPVEDRVRRLVARGLEESDAWARIRAQASDQQRRAAADVWLDNAGSVDDVLAEVDELWADRLVRFESGVRLRHPAERGPVRVVDPDPDWPSQAQRLLSRIEQAAGDGALRVDHIGSTSVPGLAAQDVVDVQLTVRSWEDAGTFADQLGAAGFPLGSEITGGSPVGRVQDEEWSASYQWHKRYHASADPGRPADVYVRVADSPNWHCALLFPAWLRADAAARGEYEAFKRKLADGSPSESDAARYAKGKQRWFTENLPRAQEWADRTGWHPPAT